LRDEHTSDLTLGDNQFEWLQEFKFIVAADWDDEERPEIVEFTFYREAKYVSENPSCLFVYSKPL
jgi:hypothetical protein